MALQITEEECLKHVDLVAKTGKLILVGCTGVGKTTLLEKFLFGMTKPKVESTVWPSVFCFRFPTEGEIFSMEVWDISGQERFRPLAHFYFPGVDVVLIVFDLTKSTSFTQAKTWALEILYYCKKAPSLILVGNKRDLHRRREIPKMEASMFADKVGASYLECSAKDKKDVCRIFYESSKIILNLSRSNTFAVQADREKPKWYEKLFGLYFKSIFC